MSDGGKSRLASRLAALFAAGCVLFGYPLLGLFARPLTVFGVPLLYVYLFAVWGLLIATLAWLLELRSPSPSRRPGPAARGAPAEDMDPCSPSGR